MHKVRWVLLYRFCSKFHRLSTVSSSVKFFENRLIFDKVTESLKVETFLRHSVGCGQGLRYCYAVVSAGFSKSVMNRRRSAQLRRNDTLADVT